MHRHIPEVDQEHHPNPHETIADIGTPQEVAPMDHDVHSHMMINSGEKSKEEIASQEDDLAADIPHTATAEKGVAPQENCWQPLHTKQDTT